MKAIYLRYSMIIAAFFSVYSYGAAPKIYWTKAISAPASIPPVVYSARYSTILGSNIVIIGNSYKLGASSDTNIILFRIDSTGIILSQKSFHKNVSFEQVSSIENANDTSIVACGWRYENGKRIGLVQYYNRGCDTVATVKLCPTDTSSTAIASDVAPDGSSCFGTGILDRSVNDSLLFFSVKNGNVVRMQGILPIKSSTSSPVISASNVDNYLFIGCIYNDSINIVKVDTAGIVSWAKTYGAYSNQSIKGIAPCNNGDIIITGQKVNDAMALRINSNGIQIFNTVYDYGYGSSNKWSITSGASIRECPDKTILIAGQSRSESVLYHDPTTGQLYNTYMWGAYLVKIDPVGDTLWYTTAGTEFSPTCSAVDAIPLADGGFYSIHNESNGVIYLTRYCPLSLTLPDSVKLNMPAKGAITNSTTAKFSWFKSNSPFVTKYEFKLIWLLSGMELIEKDTLIADTSIAVLLLDNSSYSWTVRAINPVGQGPFCGQWQFTVNTNATDIVPQKQIFTNVVNRKMELFDVAGRRITICSGNIRVRNSSLSGLYLARSNNRNSIIKKRFFLK